MIVYIRHMFHVVSLTTGISLLNTYDMFDMVASYRRCGGQV